MQRSSPNPDRYRRYVGQEFDNVLLYRRLAEQSTGEHREVLLELASAEERHARYWQQKLTDLGLGTAEFDQHRLANRTRFLSFLARRLGVRTIVPLLERVEAAERGRYDADPEVTADMAADELVHAQLVAGLSPPGAHGPRGRCGPRCSA